MKIGIDGILAGLTMESRSKIVCYVPLWKTPLLERLKDENWHVDSRKLENII